MYRIYVIKSGRETGSMTPQQPVFSRC